MIKYSLILALLMFQATDASAAPITDIEIEALDIRHSAFQPEWKKMEKQLSKLVQIKEDSQVTEQGVQEMERVLGGFLAKEGFFGSEILRVEVLEQKTQNILKIKLNLGEKVGFGFQGNQRFTESELKELVAEQRSLGLGKNYAEEISARISDLYKSKGYAHVKIFEETFESPKKQSRHVTYFVDEGPRVRIEEIKFDGNIHFSQPQLRKEFYDIAQLLTQRNIYVEEEVQKASSLLVDRIKAQGFLSAKFTAINRRFSADQSVVDLVIFIYEGEQTLVRDISISGVTQMQQSHVIETLGLEREKPLNLFEFSEGLEKIKAEYQAMGYLDATILNEARGNVVTYSRNNRFADIKLEMAEGFRYRVGKITVSGLVRTHKEVVLREVVLQEGDILEGTLLSESEINIRKLGLFSSVRMQTRNDPEKPGVKDIRVVLSELEPGVLSGGVGFRNDQGIRVFGEIGHTNMWRRNHSGTFGAAINKRVESVRENDSQFVEFEVELGYNYPWFLIPRMTFKPRFQFEKEKYIEFDVESFVFTASFERQLLRRPNLIASLTYSLENTRQFNAPAAEDNETLTIGAIIPALSIDLRDNPLSPTEGFFARASFEYASPGMGSESDLGYSKLEFRADGFVPIARGVTWYLSFRTGWSRNNIDPDSAADPDSVGIPLIKQFTLGGVRSLRGFRFQEVNVFNQTTIRGTLSFVNYRTQLDMPLAGQMRFGPFIDAGNLFVDRYSLGSLRYSAGFGIHYKTPVGPINFDWGFKIDPEPGEDKSRFHFSIGIL